MVSQGENFNNGNMRGRKMKMSSTSSSSSSRSIICDTKITTIFFKKYFYLERDMFGKPGTLETKSETNYTEQIQFLLEKKMLIVK